MLRKIKFIYPSVAVLLLAVLILPLFLIGVGADNADYDYSSPASTDNKAMTSAELLSMYLGEPLGEAERAYLERHGSLTLYYNDRITTDKALTLYEDGELTVMAYEYSYLTKSSTKVTWIPERVRVGDVVCEFVPHDGGYKAVFFGIAEDESLAAEITYTLDLSVAKDDMNTLLSEALTDAPVWKERIAAYEKEYRELKESYDNNVILYDEYLRLSAEYESNLAAYTDYLSRKKIYDDALTAYNEYVEEMDIYNDAYERYENYERALAVYNTAYEEYRAYLSALAEYNAKCEEYTVYQEKLSEIRNQLSIIEAAKVKMTDDRDVYSAIMGSLVTEVLVGNKDLLTSPTIGADGALIDAAQLATENLRVLLPHYFSLTDEAEKYSYYTVNFDAFKENFTKLAQVLDELYRNRRIRAELIAQERDRKYYILVVQLAIIANALNDGPIDTYSGSGKFDSAYKIEKQTINTILENKQYIPDISTAKPVKDGYPGIMAEPVSPEEKTEPVKPTEEKKPTKPAEVEDPGDAPDVVEEPTEPTVVSPPGEEPKPYVPTAELTELVAAYDRGELAERESTDSDYCFKLEHVLTKRLFNVTEATVKFCSQDGTVLETITVDSGTCADFRGVLPTKEEDERAVYVFVGWGDEHGNIPDLSSVTEDMMLYPVFDEVIKYYNVTFNVDGVETVLSLPYGEMPEYAGIPLKGDSGAYRYEFTGWDKEFRQVNGDAYYTAEFSAEYILPTEDGGAEITVEDEYYIADCGDGDIVSLDIKELADRCVDPKSRRGMKLRTSEYDAELSYSTLLKMLENEETVVSVSTQKTGKNAYAYIVNVTDEFDTPSAVVYKIDVSIPCDIEDTEAAVLYRVRKNGERERVRHSIADKKLSFTAETDAEYELVCEYKVNVIPSLKVDMSASHSIALSDELIEVTVDVPLGVRIVKLYLLDDDGNETVIENGSFIMPSSNVTVGVVAEDIIYKITFMNGDDVIATSMHKYGDTATPPKNPTKHSDGKYGYTFIGWSDTDFTVTRDKTYSAVYESTLLPERTEPDGLQISPSILRLLIAALVALGMMVFAVLPSVITTSVILFRERGKYTRK